jgi:integrase
LARLVSKFLEWVDGRYGGGHTVKNLEYSIRAVLDFYRNDPAKAFGPKKLQEVRLLIARQGRTRQGINKATGYIRQMFKWAVAEELVKPDQLVALTALAPLRYGAVNAAESPAREALAKDLVDATLPYLSPTVATMVRVQMFTGMRPAEVCKLSIGDIDRTKPDVWVYRPANHKMAHLGRTRLIPFVRDVIDLLEPFLRADGKPIFSPSETRQAWEVEKRAKCKARVQPS